MNEADLMRTIEPLLGKPYSEMPCRELVARVYGFPVPTAFEVAAGELAVGDIICYGPAGEGLVPDFSLGIHLGNGKLVTSFVEYGVRIVPLKYIRREFRWGARVG